MHFDVLTLFPRMFESPFEESIVNRAIEQGLVSVSIHNIRDYATDRHRVTDDTPYGGGGGMVMKPEPIFRAVESILGGDVAPSTPVILLSPQGRSFTQAVAWELTAHPSEYGLVWPMMRSPSATTFSPVEKYQPWSLWMLSPD
jgi:tRNA (guanine37-N1)-methyltransferase